MKQSEIKELYNGQDFKNFYLDNAPVSFCEDWNNISYSQGNGFLDIAKLEDLKEKQKPIEGHSDYDFGISIRRSLGYYQF